MDRFAYSQSMFAPILVAEIKRFLTNPMKGNLSERGTSPIFNLTHPTL